MKKYLFITIYFFVSFISCTQKPYSDFTTENYELMFSSEQDRFYELENGNVIELPKLPAGFKLKYDFFPRTSGDYPKLIYWKPAPYPDSIKSDGNGNSICNIRKLWLGNDSFIVEDTHQTKIEIDISAPTEWNIVTEIDESYLQSCKYFEFESITENAKKSVVKCGFSLQDIRLNKYYHVDYSTPYLDGIIKIGLYKDEFYFGETIYSFFMLDLKTDNLIYFKDKEEYQKFCSERIDKEILILESPYLYNYEKRFL